MASKRTIKKKQITKDCWALDYAFYKWLREHLPVYFKDADRFIDLTYYKQMHRGVELTQREALLKMIELVNRMEKHDEWDPEFAEWRTELMELWTQWLPSLWW